MTRPLKITKDVHFRSMKRGRKELREGVETPLPMLGSVPRVSRVLALAIHMADLCRQRPAGPGHSGGDPVPAPCGWQPGLCRREDGPAYRVGARLAEAEGDVEGPESRAPGLIPLPSECSLSCCVTTYQQENAPTHLTSD
jgi:hypothetical protein